MYRCSKCKLGVLVKGLSQPIRACSCTVKVERFPETFWEKVLYIFGKKFFLEKKAPIICEMDSTVISKSTCSL